MPGKHPNRHHDHDKKFEWDPDNDQGQMLGKVTKCLGNRRFKVYCDDNQDRICKLAGTIRKSEWVDEGTLVVLSVREIANRAGHDSKSNQGELGDILMTVPSSAIGKLKKNSDLNPALFSNLSGANMSDVKKKVAEGTMEDDDLFDTEDDGADTAEINGPEDVDTTAESDVKGAVDGEELEKREKNRLRAREEASKKRDTERAANRSKKSGPAIDADGNINIDAI